MLNSIRTNFEARTASLPQGAVVNNTTALEVMDTVHMSSAPGASPAPPAPGETHKSSVMSKLIAIPRFLLEGVAGSVGAVVGAVFKTLPGAVEGMVHGVHFEPKDPNNPYDYYRPETGWYTVTSLAESMAAGAGVGVAFGGPLGAAVGTGAGFMVGVVGRIIEGRSKIAKEFVRKVDTRVDGFLEANTEGTKTKVAFQNVVEGTIVGARTGFSQGLSLGWDAGKGAVSGIADVTEGALEGLKEAIFGK